MILGIHASSDVSQDTKPKAVSIAWMSHKESPVSLQRLSNLRRSLSVIDAQTCRRSDSRRRPTRGLNSLAHLDLSSLISKLSIVSSSLLIFGFHLRCSLLL